MGRPVKALFGRGGAGWGRAMAGAEEGGGVGPVREGVDFSGEIQVIVIVAVGIAGRRRCSVGGPVRNWC